MFHPRYPEKARQARAEGFVMVDAHVRADGSVGDVYLLLATPRGLGFETAGMEAVSRSQYQPATRDGTPVSVMVLVRLAFKLH